MTWRETRRWGSERGGRRLHRGESRGALPLVHLNEDGARGEISSVPRVAAASRSRRASRRLGFHDLRGGQGARVRRVLSSCARFVTHRCLAKTTSSGWVGSGRTRRRRTVRVGSGGRARAPTVVWCARVVQWRPRGRVDSAHSRVFPGKSTANGRFLGFSRGTLSFFPHGRDGLFSILHARPRSSYPRALAGVASCRGDARL